MRYEGNVYRPPSEAYSLIIQATIGCTHNKCTFCSMYKNVKFKLKPYELILSDLYEARSLYRHVKRIFFADGDGFCMSADKLCRLLEDTHKIFPECTRVGIYSRASHILRKTEAELIKFSELGLGIIYIGAESGSEEILLKINKGETAKQITEAVQKTENSGIKTSVTFISGLGGRERLCEHAEKTGGMISKMGASYVGLLTLLTDPAAPLHKDIETGVFKPLTPEEITDELLIMINHTDCKKETVLRSNHASNWLELKGTLPYDKEVLLEQIRFAKINGLRDGRLRRL